MQNYFNATCQNIETAKAMYKELYIFHCADANVMADINAQFTAFKKAYEIGVIQPNTQPEEVTGTDTNSIEFIAKNVALLSGCTVEVCNKWIWVKCDKDNYEAHENLKAKKFRFSGNKKAWYYTDQPFKKRRGSKTLPQIRVKFGSEAVQGEIL